VCYFGTWHRGGGGGSRKFKYTDESHSKQDQLKGVKWPGRWAKKDKGEKGWSHFLKSSKGGVKVEQC